MKERKRLREAWLLHFPRDRNVFQVVIPSFLSRCATLTVLLCSSLQLRTLIITASSSRAVRFIPPSVRPSQREKQPLSRALAAAGWRKGRKGAGQRPPTAASPEKDDSPPPPVPLPPRRRQQRQTPEPEPDFCRYAVTPPGAAAGGLVRQQPTGPTELPRGAGGGARVAPRAGGGSRGFRRTPEPPQRRRIPRPAAPARQARAAPRRRFDRPSSRLAPPGTFSRLPRSGGVSPGAAGSLTVRRWRQAGGRGKRQAAAGSPARRPAAAHGAAGADRRGGAAAANGRHRPRASRHPPHPHPPQSGGREGGPGREGNPRGGHGPAPPGSRRPALPSAVPGGGTCQQPAGEGSPPFYCCGHLLPPFQPALGIRQSSTVSETWNGQSRYDTGFG